MAVRCLGDCGPMEQVGEKQDFETALTLHGLRHEDFTLCVCRRAANAQNEAWIHDYIVTVVAAHTGGRHDYTGGPCHDWVAQFVLDVARGVYGHRFEADPPGENPPPARLPKILRYGSSAQRRTS